MENLYSVHHLTVHKQNVYIWMHVFRLGDPLFGLLHAKWNLYLTWLCKCVWGEIMWELQPHTVILENFHVSSIVFGNVISRSQWHCECWCRFLICRHIHYIRLFDVCESLYISLAFVRSLLTWQYNNNSEWITISESDLYSGGNARFCFLFLEVNVHRGFPVDVNMDGRLPTFSCHPGYGGCRSSKRRKHPWFVKCSNGPEARRTPLRLLPATLTFVLALFQPQRESQF